MIIDDLNIVSIAILPPETNPPLVIDTNTPMPSPITFQLFQSVIGRHPEIVHFLSGVQHSELTQSSPFKGMETANSLQIV